MIIKKYQTTAIVVLLALLVGCEGNAINDMPSNQVSAKETPANAVQLVQKEEAATPIPITIDTIKSEIKDDLTQDQVHTLFGIPASSEENYIMMNGKMSVIDQYIYEEGPSKLVIQWSKEGQLLYAVFYDTDASGNRRSFLPAIKGLSSSSSENNLVAREHAIELDKPVTLYMNTNAYEWWGGTRAVNFISVDARAKYKVVTLSDDFAEIQDESGYGGFVPVWYLTKEAAQVKDIAPLSLKAKESAKAKWYPNSQGDATTMKEGDIIYAYKQYGDWYGAAVPDSAEGDKSYGLLWIRKDQVTSAGGAAPLFEIENSKQAVAAAVRSVLVPGLEKARVKAIFGEPSFEESSENVAPLEEKARTLPLWRYEGEQNELIVAWSEAGTLRYSIYRDSPELIAPQYGVGAQGPLAPSLHMQWDWRFKSDLGFNFLLEKVGNVLLIAGEDGGFSGMHNNSNIYALDSATGRKKWQFDFGFGRHDYGLSQDKERIAFLKSSMKEDRTVHTLQSLKTATGQKMWQKKLDNGKDVTSFAVSKNVISAVQSKRVSTTEEKFTYDLIGWSMGTGKQLWNFELAQESELVRDVGNQDVLLVQVGEDMSPVILNELQAYDPLTGKVLWKKPERKAASDQEVTDSVRYAERSKAFWTRTVDELVLVDAKTGKDGLRLPLVGYSRYDIIDENYIFLQQSSDNNLYSENVKSSLIDVKSGRPLFTLEGRAEFGKIEGSLLYYRLNGKAMSFDLKKEEQRWTTSGVPGKQTDGASVVHYGGKLIGVFPGLGNMYVLDESTGEAVNRLSDVKVGYYDFTPNELLNGYLSVIDGQLYVGSSNGYFSKIK